MTTSNNDTKTIKRQTKRAVSPTIQSKAPAKKWKRFLALSVYKSADDTAPTFKLIWHHNRTKTEHRIPSNWDSDHIIGLLENVAPIYSLEERRKIAGVYFLLRRNAWNLTHKERECNGLVKVVDEEVVVPRSRKEVKKNK